MTHPVEYWLQVLPTLPEAQRRWLAGAKALEFGWGGLGRVQRLTGFSVNTVAKGIREVQEGLPTSVPGRMRSAGAGRPSVERADPTLLAALRQLVDENTAGSPMKALLWTHKSTRNLAAELGRHGHAVSPNTVGRLLETLGYSLQVNAKNKEGRSPPERDLQFRHINERVATFQREGNPVLSVDCKKKEKVGAFKNAGTTYRPKGKPVEVNVYDFPDLAVGKAIPYGVYDVTRNRGFVNVGVTYETAEFAVESLRRWWKGIGRAMYPRATGWLVCADGGGGNGRRNRGWKLHLQELAEELGISMTLCHYPPGTSKWNKIE
ncbi:MAG: ISAzo13 family transposase [Thermoplasmata archaeon]